MGSLFTMAPSTKCLGPKSTVRMTEVSVTRRAVIESSTVYLNIALHFVGDYWSLICSFNVDTSLHNLLHTLSCFSNSWLTSAGSIFFLLGPFFLLLISRSTMVVNLLYTGICDIVNTVSISFHRPGVVGLC